MRAPYPPADIDLLTEHFEHADEIARVRTLTPSFAEASTETASAILQQAARFAEERLAPLNETMDRIGARFDGSSVKTAPAHADTWAAFVEDQWPSLDHSIEHGGQQLPLSLTLAAQELFDRSCPAFGMMITPQRSAARLIEAFGDEAQRQAWLPGLAAGRIGATICISESGAGSDLAQMRTRAFQDPQHQWRITGEKCWISFGHHDLTERILHCVLARSDPAQSPSPEISLFLVEAGPDVSVRRIEEKLGLHGSPTCALGFENAAATLLGTRGRGLQQMFVMISQMRLSVGIMGLGIASGCLDTALKYAEERRQGGKPGAPVPIVQHLDVQRQLFEMVARVEVLRGLVLSTANLADIARYETDPSLRQSTVALVQWLLPVVKTFGAEAAFDTASEAIQVLGGAGYTRDWPIEQALRDARVLAVFEGTSGIQALDLAHRRVVRDDSGLAAFLQRARAAHDDARLGRCLDLLESAAAEIRAMDSGDIDASASAFLHLAILAAGGWIAGRCLRLQTDTPARLRMRAAAEYWLDHCPERAALCHAEVLKGRRRLMAIDAIRRAV
jgi:alkylation response protein AidB-like acyl-CoA dehydrogenase